MASLSIDYPIDGKEHIENLDDSKVVGTPIFTGAHALIYSFETQDGDLIDADMFSYVAPKFTIKSSDLDKAGLY